MSQNKTRSISHWSYKHDEFCLENNIFPAARYLWVWLLKQGYVGESEPDLAKFNNWVAQWRKKGGYSRNHLKSALNKLIECRVINLIKRYTWRVVKIFTRPIEYIKRKKKLQTRNIFDSLDRSKAYSADSRFKQQQHLNIIDNQILLSKYGISFNEDQKEVLDRPRNEILASVILFQIRGGFEKIPNPQGWIRECCRKRYWDEPTAYKQILHKYGNTTLFSEIYPNDG